jgi:hypothetical protein
MTYSSAAARGSALLLALTFAAVPAQASSVTLAPYTPGLFKAGSGIDAEFLKIHDDWRGSSVLYESDTDQLGVGVPIGSFSGGSGLWGLVDWRTAFLNPAQGMIQASWSQRVLSIAFADQVFNDQHGNTWATMPLLPLFEPAALQYQNQPQDLSQDNWAARFRGYIRITEAGTYNFGVLHDDGFFFTLLGADGVQATVFNDYLNPPNRKSFADALQLDVGLYAFELGAYEHLEAGAVALSWQRNGSEWSPIPTGHLVSGTDVTPVPEPGTWALLLAGLAALAAISRRYRPPAR